MLNFRGLGCDLIRIIILSYPPTNKSTPAVSPVTFRNSPGDQQPPLQIIKMIFTPQKKKMKMKLPPANSSFWMEDMSTLMSAAFIICVVASSSHANDLANLAVVKRWSPRVEGSKILLARRSKNVSRLSIHKLQQVLVCLFRTKNNRSFGRYDHMMQSGSG